MKAERIICENSSYDAFSTFVVRNNISADKLVPGLKTDGTHIIVDLQMETNIKGLLPAVILPANHTNILNQRGRVILPHCRQLPTLQIKVKENKYG